MSLIENAQCKISASCVQVPRNWTPCTGDPIRVTCEKFFVKYLVPSFASDAAVHLKIAKVIQSCVPCHFESSKPAQIVYRPQRPTLVLLRRFDQARRVVAGIVT